MVSEVEDLHATVELRNVAEEWPSWLRPFVFVALLLVCMGYLKIDKCHVKTTNNLRPFYHLP